MQRYSLNLKGGTYTEGDTYSLNPIFRQQVVPGQTVNIDFESSFKLAILTLMNTVNSSAYGLSDLDFNNLHFFTKYFMIIFMIIGRVELLSLLLIVKKFLFKN